MAAFDDQSARRISRTVRGWERRVRGRQQGRARWHGKGNFRIYTCELTEDLFPGDSATAILLTGPAKDVNGGAIIVFDVPTSITSGKMIASGVICRIFKDPDVDLAADEYVFLLPFTCETDQTGSGS